MTKPRHRISLLLHFTLIYFGLNTNEAFLIHEKFHSLTPADKLQYIEYRSGTPVNPDYTS